MTVHFLYCGAIVFHHSTDVIFPHCVAIVAVATFQQLRHKSPFVILLLPFQSRFSLSSSHSTFLSFVTHSLSLSLSLSLTSLVLMPMLLLVRLFVLFCLWMECTKINSWIRFFMPWKTYISQHFLYLSIPITLCECAQILFLHSYMHESIPIRLPSGQRLWW